MKSSDASLHGTYFDLLKAKYPDLNPETGRAVQRAPQRRSRRRSRAPMFLLAVALLAGSGWLVIEWWPGAVWRQATQTPEAPLPTEASASVSGLLGETGERAPQTLIQQPAVESNARVVPAPAGNTQPVGDVEAQVVAPEPSVATVPESLASIEELASLEATETSLLLASKSLGPEWITISGDEASVVDEASALDETSLSDEAVGLGSVDAAPEPSLAAAKSPIVEDPNSVLQVAQNPAPTSQPIVLQPTSSSPVNPGPFEVGGAVKPPRRLVTPLPNYPDAAWAQGITGDVLVRALIDERGKVAEIEVLRGLPYGMTEAAIEAIERWRFAPATRHGEAVSVYRNLSVRFES